MSSDRQIRRRPGRERLLAAVDRFFYREGVSASAVEALLLEAGVARGTLYKNFRTRDELLEAYLRVRHERTLEALERFASGSGSLGEKIDSIFDYLSALAQEDTFRGCAFVVAAAELPNSQRPPVRWAHRHKRAVFETFLEMFRTHGASDAQDRAQRLCILYDGALITSYLRPDSDAVAVARSMARQLLLQTPD